MRRKSPSFAQHPRGASNKRTVAMFHLAGLLEEQNPPGETFYELREDGGIELREDGGFELREA